MRSTLSFAIFLLSFSILAFTPAPLLARQVTHTVVAGDSLWSIASRCHVSVAVLEARNHLTDASVLQLGQTIVVADAPKAAVRTARSIHKGSNKGSNPKRLAVAGRHRSAPPRPTAMPSGAAKNAVWVATHTGQAPAPPSSLNFNLAERIIAFDEKVTHTALRYVGVPYVWGGTSFSGVDCSGFVQAVFERNGINIPRTADSQFDVGRHIKMVDLQAGDLVFFETYAAGASHVGIYLGGGRFIHASSSNGVRVDQLAEGYYASRYIGARRLIR